MSRDNRPDGVAHAKGGRVFTLTTRGNAVALYLWRSPGGRWRYVYGDTPARNVNPREWFKLTRDVVKENESLRADAAEILAVILPEAT